MNGGYDLNRANLLLKIEKLREELNEIMKRKNEINNEELVKKSKELDKALNEYYRLIEKQK